MSSTPSPTTNKNDNYQVWIVLGVLALCALCLRSCETKPEPAHQFRSYAPTAGEQVEELRRERFRADANSEALRAEDAIQRGDAAGAVAHDRYSTYATERANRQ